MFCLVQTPFARSINNFLTNARYEVLWPNFVKFRLWRNLIWICTVWSVLAVQMLRPGRVAQSVGHLTRKSEVLGSIPGLATYFRFSFRWFWNGVVSYWWKYVYEVLVNRLGGLSLPRKSVVRLTDRPDMVVVVVLFYVHGKHYRGRKTTQ